MKAGEGFALSHWCGEREVEAQVKDETKATIRNIPLDKLANPRPEEAGACMVTRPAVAVPRPLGDRLLSRGALAGLGG